MCVSGMRISDAMILDQYMFNDAGYLEFKPHKTIRHDNTAQIPITTERQRRYFEWSLRDNFEITSPKNFRTTFNIHLKILAAKAGVNINLTSHVGRHTMGSFLVDGGVEEKAAMSILGVKSNKVIKTYMHLKQSKLVSEANKLKNVF
jgi:integrase